jgi:hypothetical protein
MYTGSQAMETRNLRSMARETAELALQLAALPAEGLRNDLQALEDIELLAKRILNEASSARTDMVRNRRRDQGNVADRTTSSVVEETRGDRGKNLTIHKPALRSVPRFLHSDRESLIAPKYSWRKARSAGCIAESNLAPRCSLSKRLPAFVAGDPRLDYISERRDHQRRFSCV